MCIVQVQERNFKRILTVEVNKKKKNLASQPLEKSVKINLSWSHVHFQDPSLVSVPFFAEPCKKSPKLRKNRAEFLC